MNMKKTISKIASVAILSTTLISFIPVNSYGATYYSPNSYNSSNTNYSTSYSSSNSSITRYYSKYSNASEVSTNNLGESSNETSNNQTTSNRNTVYISNRDQSQTNTSSYTVASSGSVTRYYSKNTETNTAINNDNTENQNTNSSDSTIVDNSDSTSTDNTNISFKSDELTKQMLTHINEERTKKGLNLLILDEKLTSVAKLKAKDMVENDYLSHTSATYGSIYTMIKDAGIKYYNAGENIARAFSVDSAHNNFMNSYMHKRAILADHFTHVGIGIKREKGGMYKISVMFIEAK